MATIAHKEVNGYTVNVDIVGDSDNGCEWFAVTAHDELRIVTLATIPCVSMATDIAMNEFFDSAVEAIEKFGTLPPYAPNTFYASRLIEKEIG